MVCAGRMCCSMCSPINPDLHFFRVLWADMFILTINLSITPLKGGLIKESNLLIASPAEVPCAQLNGFAQIPL